MKLDKPITFTPPSIPLKDGNSKTFNSVTLNELDITIVDNPQRKNVVAQLRGIPFPLVLWNGESYDKAGDYTQAQVESKITELLGNEPNKVLEGLFFPNIPSKK